MGSGSRLHGHVSMMPDFDESSFDCIYAFSWVIAANEIKLSLLSHNIRGFEELLVINCPAVIAFQYFLQTVCGISYNQVPVNFPRIGL